MAVEIKHKFESLKADGVDNTKVQPSNWNDIHDIFMIGGRLIGRSADGTGAVEEIEIGAGLQLAGGVLSLLGGDGTINPSDITVSASPRLIGRYSSGAGPAEEIQIGANLTLTAGVLAASGGGAGVTFATAAQFRNNTGGNLALSPTVAWSAAEEVSLTHSSGTVTPDFSLGFNFAFQVTTGLAVTLAAPLNQKTGQSGYIRFLQPASGSPGTISFNAAWRFPTGMSKTLTASLNAEDVVFYSVRPGGVMFCSMNKGMA